MPEFGIAFDRASVRRIDRDGRMHVEVSPISKANVCPYYGREIPGADVLGLDPQRLYKLFRDPEELAKAAPTFNNLPLTSRHVPLSAEEPHKDIVVGSTGTDADFIAPYLRNSLVIWDAQAIEGVESEKQRELSCGYWYRADMTPGEFEGVSFDGVMRDILGNHVTLVPSGRSGDDVMVMDAALEVQKPPPVHKENNMPTKTITLTPRAALIKGALAQYLRPKLAQDASPIALNGALNAALLGLGQKNWKARRKGLAQRVHSEIKTAGLAMDAEVSDLVTILELLDGGSGPEMLETAEVDPDMAPPLTGLEEDEEADASSGPSFADQVKAALESKVSPDILAAVLAALDPAAPDYVAQDAEEEKKDTDTMADKDKDKGPPPGITKAAMDAAIAEQTKATEARMAKRAQDLRKAERVVRPLVGDLDVLAMDSADSVYKYALEQAGVETNGVPPEAFPAMVALVLRNNQNGGGSGGQDRQMAQDAAVSADFLSRFPGAGRIAVG